MRLPNKKWKLNLFRLGVFLIGCFLALLLAEVFVRVCYPHTRDHVVPGGLFEIDDTLGWKLNPELNATHRSRYFNVFYKTNALGYRDRSRTPVKQANTYRITHYGDSQVFGWGVRGEKRFTDLLEDRVPSLEVWNLGVPGFGLDQQILFYESHDDTLHPDEVIFLVSKQTLNRNRSDYLFKKYKPKFSLDENGELTLQPVPKGKNSGLRLFYQVLSPFYLPYFLDQRLSAWKSGSKKAGLRERPKPSDYDVNIGAFERKLLERAKAVAMERNHRMTVLAFLGGKPSKAMQSLCEALDLQMIVAPIRVDDPSRFLGQGDYHWNEASHRMLADHLQPLVEARVTSSQEQSYPQ